MSQYSNYLDFLLKGTGKEENHKSENLSITPLTRGVLEIHSESQLAPLILSCGIHGNETAPIEILNDILRGIFNETIHPRRDLLFIFGHVKAMKEHRRFIDFNLNRLFNKNHLNYPHALESARAKELEEVVSKFLRGKEEKPWHLDLHTAIKPSHYTRFAVFPKQSNCIPTDHEIALLSGLGIDAVLLANGSANTFSSHTCENFDAFAYTLELGKVYPFGKNPHDKFKKAKQGLIQFIEGDEILNRADSPPKQFQVEKELIKDHEGYQLFLDEEYANFTPLPKGYRLEKTIDHEHILTEEMAVVFPNNNVPVGERTGLLVKEINT